MSTTLDFPASPKPNHKTMTTSSLRISTEAEPEHICSSDCTVCDGILPQSPTESPTPAKQEEEDTKVDDLVKAASGDNLEQFIYDFESAMRTLTKYEKKTVLFSIQGYDKAFETAMANTCFDVALLIAQNCKDSLSDEDLLDATQVSHEDKMNTYHRILLTLGIRPATTECETCDNLYSMTTENHCDSDSDSSSDSEDEDMPETNKSEPKPKRPRDSDSDSDPESENKDKPATKKPKTQTKTKEEDTRATESDSSDTEEEE